MVGCESGMRCSMSEAHRPTSLPIEQAPRTRSVCRMRRRVGSAIACKTRSSSCSELLTVPTNRRRLEIDEFDAPRLEVWDSQTRHGITSPILASDGHILPKIPCAAAVSRCRTNPHAEHWCVRSDSDFFFLVPPAGHSWLVYLASTSTTLLAALSALYWSSVMN